MAPSNPEYEFLDPPKSASEGGQALGTLGHYRVIRELGKGGMGYVFLAIDSRLKREVALKVMNQKIASTPGSRKRFISEARAMAAVHHDNVATIFEVGEQKGTPYMAMELLQGETLESFKDQAQRPDYQTLIRFAQQMARGLAAAHAQGIVHRDIKPANIWLDAKTGRIKILDFGLALAQTPVDQLSGRGAVIGTPGYLSPEQARSEPLDDRSDLYSTGVVLYELATGRLPLKAKTVAEQLIAILAHDPKPIVQLNDQIPKPLANLIHRLLAKEPRDRVASAAELDRILDDVAVECESTSEVAQAINQLQAGLQEVVAKKETGADFDEAPMGDSGPSVFDTLPDAMPVYDPLSSSNASLPAIQVPNAGGNAVLQNSALGVSKPGVGKPGIGTPAAQPGPKKPEAGSSSRIWIWGAIGAVALIILLWVPLYVFWSTSSELGRQESISIEGSDMNPGSGSEAGGPASRDDGSAVMANQGRPAVSPAAPEVNSRRPDRETSNQANQTPPSQTDDTPVESELVSGPLVTAVNAKAVENPNVNGATWLLNANQGNGSFDATEPAKSEDRIPGWTVRRSGNQAGWQQAKNASTGKTSTFAFAGPNSELVLTGDPLDHVTRKGDVFRVGMVVGGEGPGQTDYRVVLGFRSDSGLPVRYQLDQFADGSAWKGRNRSRHVYQYTADESVAGKRPFVELLVSNVNRKRKRGMLDQVVMTVQAPEAPRVAQDNTDTPPKPDESMVSANTPDRSPQPDPESGTDQPDPKTPPVSLRQVVLSTADEGGADATVKRGLGSNDPLGEKPILAVQTRGGKQIQHVYLRFMLDPLRPAGARSSQPRPSGGNAPKSPPLPIEEAALQLELAMPERPAAGALRLYGFNDPISDVWSEDRLYWSRSLSENGLDDLPLLAETRLGSGGQTVTISTPQLAKFLAGVDQKSVTFVLVGVNGNEPIIFSAKEDSDGAPPKLKVGLAE
ncbi:serine/threonine-protein kinase [Roseiconus nitratireducens]|nr:serine/threonine-protein kinase [Roseiconus nitratireducens]